MAILGVSFSGFGSRKLRFDSQKNNLSFGGKIDDEMKRSSAKPEQTDNNNEKPVNAPNLIYSIPKDNYDPYININYPKNENNKTTPKPFVVKYAVPDES